MRKLIVLGSGDAFASGGKYNTSFLVDNMGDHFLIDCGATTLVRLKQLNVPIEQISKIFITHFHGDHFGGLPFLMLSKMFEQENPTPIKVIGPEGMEAKLYQLQEALYPGTVERLKALPVDYITFNQSWQKVDDMSFKALPVSHAPPSNPHGIRFTLGDKDLAFSGDTEWNEQLIELARGTQLFISECNNLHKSTPGHLSLDDLLQYETMLSTERLMISHMGQEVLELKNCVFERLYDGMEINLW